MPGWTNFCGSRAEPLKRWIQATPGRYAYHPFGALALLSFSAFVAAAEEGNLTAPVPGYSVLNLRTTFRVSDRFSVFGLVDNALDSDYETFGVFGEADDVLGEDYQDTRFLSPGAPRAAWVGVRLAL